MAFGDVDIVNAALASLRSEGITLLTDDSEVARLASRKLRFTKAIILGEADWVCATRTANLVRKPNSSPYPDTLPNTFVLPTDSIRLLSVIIDQNPYNMSDQYYGRNRTRADQAYIIEGPNMYSQADTCQVRYIKEIPIAEFSTYVLIPLITLLASELAYSVANSANYADQLYKKYRKELGEAIFSNSMETSNVEKYGISIEGRSI